MKRSCAGKLVGTATEATSPFEPMLGWLLCMSWPYLLRHVEVRELVKEYTKVFDEIGIESLYVLIDKAAMTRLAVDPLANMALRKFDKYMKHVPMNEDGIVVAKVA